MTDWLTEADRLWDARRAAAAARATEQHRTRIVPLPYRAPHPYARVSGWPLFAVLDPAGYCQAFHANLGLATLTARRLGPGSTVHLGQAIIVLVTPTTPAVH